MVDKLLREKILSQYPNSNIVDIIIQRRQTTQEIETKESVTLIEISIPQLFRKNCWSFKRTIERIKGFIRTSLRKKQHLIIYQKPNYFKCTKSTKPLRISVNYC
jgi:hypothetical protein